ncbi:MAG TPA: GYD domain-containing protein [Polyangia bacterium]|jgi:uncharacterized protein with GYD domain
MATYLVLSKFTDQGAKNIKESPARVEVARQIFKKAGAEVKEFYALLGAYDTTMIVTAPDDTAVTQACLALGALGNVHTQTLRAYNEKEYREMIAKLP